MLSIFSVFSAECKRFSIRKFKILKGPLISSVWINWWKYYIILFKSSIVGNNENIKWQVILFTHPFEVSEGCPKTGVWGTLGNPGVIGLEAELSMLEATPLLCSPSLSYRSLRWINGLDLSYEVSDMFRLKLEYK